jgi:hypothetical protein
VYNYRIAYFVEVFLYQLAQQVKLITLLAQDTEAYDISYKDCRFVIEFLNATLKERRM